MCSFWRESDIIEALLPLVPCPPYAVSGNSPALLTDTNWFSSQVQLSAEALNGWEEVVFLRLPEWDAQRGEAENQPLRPWSSISRAGSTLSTGTGSIYSAAKVPSGRGPRHTNSFHSLQGQLYEPHQIGWI